METLHLRDAWGNGWAAFKRRVWYLFGLTAAVICLTIFLSNGNTTISGPYGEYIKASTSITSALALLLSGGYLALLLKHARNEAVVFDDLFDIDRRWIYYAFGGLIKMFLVGLGFLLFIVPGVYLAVRWMFSGLYIIDQGMRPIEALKASSKLTEGYFWKLFAYMLLMTLLMIASVFALLVGVFAAVVFIYLSNIFLFWKLQELQHVNRQVDQNE